MFKDELLRSPTTSLQDIVCSCLRAAICLLRDGESGLQSASQGFMFLQQGSWYLSHRSYMAFLLSTFIKRLCKPAYNKTLNSMNLKSLSTFATVEGFSWKRNVSRGFSDTIFFQDAHLFLMRCVGGTEQMNIHECAEGLYVSSWFPPVSSSYANYVLTSPYGHAAPSLSLINDAVKMFSLRRKISSIKAELPRILIEVITLDLFWPDD